MERGREKQIEVLGYPCVIQPAFLEDNVPVIFTSSDYYLPFCAVAIWSMLENADQTKNYDILIATTGISDVKLGYLQRMIKGMENVSIRIMNLEEIFKDRELFVYAHVSRETYFRLALPFILKAYEKFVFLDSDIIVKGDISTLYALDLENFYLAAVPDIVMAGLCNGYSMEFAQYVKNELKIEDYQRYFNAGVIVFNCAELRQHFEKDDLLKRAQEKQYRLFDQDVLNIACGEKLKRLGLEWNYPPDCETVPNVHKKDYIACAPEHMRREYEAAGRCPMIVHYTDHAKPWHYPYEDMANDFWEAARNTPFFEAILYRLYESQSQEKLDCVQCRNEIQYYPQGKLCKRIVKKIVKLFLPDGTRRKAVVKKCYFKLRGWEI